MSFFNYKDFSFIACLPTVFQTVCDNGMLILFMDYLTMGSVGQSIALNDHYGTEICKDVE